MSTAFWIVLVVAAGIAILAVCARSSPLEPVPTHPLGVVVHHLTADRVAVLQRIGVTSVRIPWYGDIPDLLGQMALALDAHFQVLIVANATVTDELVRNTPAGVIIQVGNEPAAPVLYAAQFRQVVQAFGARATFWPAGLSNNVDAYALRRAIAAGLGDAGVICLHAYGTPLVNAVKDRLAVALEAGWTGVLALTEVGALTVRSGDLGPALAAIPQTVSAWIYSLDDVEGFALTPPEQNTIATFTGVKP